MTFDEFLRIYPLRTQNLMWFLGAGASAASGIPTAADLIWEFKRALYCSAQRVSIRTCADLSSSVVRERFNAHFQTLGGFPMPGVPEEYGAYFEAAYPNPSDRRTLLDGFLTGAKPSYGHMVLAVFLRTNLTRLIWTTNFDRLIEDAAAGSSVPASRMIVAALDNAPTAVEALNDGRWPLLGKLHGDFQSRRLKNTTDELRTQDATLRRALVEAARRFGLVVVGYSGRDQSIMDALEEAIAGGQGYPSGLFWFERPEQPVLPRVTQLLQKANAAGISAELLHVQTFDELLGDLVKQIKDLPLDVLKDLDAHGQRVADIPVGQPGNAWPVIRTNALPLQSWPTLCRLVECSVPGFKALREALPPSMQVVATLTRKGVLAFGNDQHLQRALNSYNVRKLDTHTIDQTHLDIDSFELGLLRDALGVAIERSAPVTVHRKRTALMMHTREEMDGLRLGPLRACAGQLHGTVPGTKVQWHEAVRAHLELKLGRLWLLIEPTVYLANPDDATHAATADFVRERLAVRYNRQWNALLEAWLTILFDDAQTVTITAFGSEHGIDAAFTIQRVTGFSRRNAQQ